MTRPLKVAIGIATAGRREQMPLTLAQIARQQTLPQRIVVCPAGLSDYDAAATAPVGCPIEVLFGPRGLTAQRNRILEACPDIDVLIFLDDDYYPADDYIEQVTALFSAYPDIVVATNHPVRDGASGPGIGHDEALAILAAQGPLERAAPHIKTTYGGYGCNMAVRVAPALEHGVRFDVNLPLYGWLEDIDFSRRMAAHGRIANCSTLVRRAPGGQARPHLGSALRLFADRQPALPAAQGIDVGTLLAAPHRPQRRQERAAFLPPRTLGRPSRAPQGQPHRARRPGARAPRPASHPATAMTTLATSLPTGFRDHDERIRYFVKGAPVQNFGDYLPELLAKAFFLHPRVDADVYRLIGSVIESDWIRRDLRRSVGIERGVVAFWGCGKRDATPLPARTQSMCRFFGVRGPLTRDALGLPADTVLGDPGLLAPLMHTPAPAPDTAGRSICIPHFDDTKSDAELLAISGADRVLRPAVPADEASLRLILDRIAAARFVLTASLHGAIVACAYGRPFAFWDNGHIDVVFKWQDFAASIGVPCEFVRDLRAGESHFGQVLAPRMTVPALVPILDTCPFTVRPAALLRALQHDGRLADDASPAQAAAALDALPSARPETVLALQDASATRRAARDRLPVALLAAGGRAVERLKAVWRDLRGIR